jgi:hypothetical protein
MWTSVPESNTPSDPTVGALSELYLGNLLYALERCALALDDEEKREESAFYRGIARELALAHGRARTAP